MDTAVKLTLDPIKTPSRKRPRGYTVRDERGAARGVVRQRPFKRGWLLTGRNLHTHFPVLVLGRQRRSTMKHFDTLPQVRAFLADRPEQYWRE